MSGAAFLRVGKLKGGGIIAMAARHNKREIQSELGSSGSIDSTRSHLNQSLHGPAGAAEVGQLARDLMAAVGVERLRKDAVTGLEIVVSLPVAHSIDCRAYFVDCVTWAVSYFGCILLAADAHHDEAQDHCHILLLPLVNGRMIGNKLMGGTAKLKAMQQSFFDLVASRYGLRKAASKIAGSVKRDAASKVLEGLRKTADSALNSKVWATIRDAIEQSPEPFMTALGLAVDARAPKKLKPFVDYVTSTGKGPRRERETTGPNAIAFACTSNAIAFDPHKKSEGYVSVAFAQKSAPSGPTQRATPPPSSGQDSGQWTVDEDGVIHPDNATERRQVAKAGHEATTPTQPETTVTVPVKPKSVTKASTLIRPDTPESMDASLAWIFKTRGPAGVRDWHAAQQETNELTRQRDEDHEAGQWCEELGEFVSKVNGTAKTARANADDWVASELLARGRASAQNSTRSHGALLLNRQPAASRTANIPEN